jgi:hypothetical protein
MLRCGGAYIRPAASFRLGLAPHLPLAKISADPENRILSFFIYTNYVFIIEDIIRRELQISFS